MVVAPVPVHATASSGLLMSIARIVTREASEEVAQQLITRLSKELGGELVERVQARLLREGGEALVQETAELAVKYGPDVLRALDNSIDPIQVLKWIDEIPADEAVGVFARLAAGSAGRELVDLGSKAGLAVIRAEAKHPGVGIAFACKLPKEWAEATLDLSAHQAIVLGKHIDDIAMLPPHQQKQLLDLCKSNPKGFLGFLEDFVSKNPGKVLFTAGTTTVLIANSRQLFGDERLAGQENPGGFFGYLAKLGYNLFVSPVKFALYGVSAVFISYLCVLYGSKLVFYYKDRSEKVRSRTEQIRNR